MFQEKNSYISGNKVNKKELKQKEHKGKKRYKNLKVYRIIENWEICNSKKQNSNEHSLYHRKKSLGIHYVQYYCYAPNVY